MRRTRCVPKVFYDLSADPFESAEQAWFWFIRCEKARRDGARFEEGMAEIRRPCDPADIYRAVLNLYRTRAIRRDHMRVLGRFGRDERPPDARCREEAWPARLWDEALDKLTAVLRGKGIVR